MVFKKITRTLELLLTRIFVPFYAVFPRFMRNGLVFFTERLYTGALNAQCYRDILTHHKIGDTLFKLWVIGGHKTAQETYLAAQESGVSYEPLMFECLRCALDVSKKPVFMDVGAFMGYYACYVSAYLKDKSPVYAVESNPDYCKYIERSIKENRFPNLKMFHGVLSDREEELSVFKERVTKDDPRGKKIMSVTLDKICSDNAISPTILKVDIDGAEGKAFLGAKNILRNSVNFIILELHPDDALERSSGGMKSRDVISLIESCGFKSYLIGGFRFKRSSEKRKFDQTGKISYLEITPENREIIFYDRFVDMFVLSIKNHDISSLKCFDPNERGK